MPKTKGASTNESKSKFLKIVYSAMTATIQSSAALLSPSATTEESLGICADAPGNTKTADDFIQFEAASQKSKTINSNAVFELEGGDENAEQTQRETVDVDVDCPVYLFIQMELCEKKTLSTWLSERQETREYAQIITIFKQVGGKMVQLLSNH